MWLSGAHGVGKSAIVQTVCEILGGDDGSKPWLTRFGLSDRCATLLLIRDVANFSQRCGRMPLLRTWPRRPRESLILSCDNCIPAFPVENAVQ